MPPTTIHHCNEQLQGLRLFEGVEFHAIETLLNECRIHLLRRNDTLIERGEQNLSLFLVIHGGLNIHLDRKGEAIAHLGPGDTVGEVSVFDKQSATAHVIAAQESALLEISEPVLWLMVRASHHFGRNLLILLAERLRSANRAVDDSLQLQRKFAYHATVDPLTGLYNRRWLDDTLNSEISHALQSQRQLCFMMIDIDHFKRYNDRYGHLAGDRALQAVAEAMRNSLRTPDVPVRYGGEEFAVILPRTELSRAQHVAERLRSAIGELKIRGPEGQLLPSVSASIGVAQLQGRCRTETLIAQADQALYQAKRQGRNRVTVAGATE